MASKIEVVLQVTSKGTRQLQQLEGRVMRFSSNIKKTFRSMATLPNIIAGAAVFKMGQSFVSAASKIEIFRAQLEGVTKSAEEAEQALAGIREFARQSPLETEDVVQAYVRLRSVGIDPTIEQLNTLGGVAVLMNRKLSEVIPALISMEKEPLRNLGIEIDRTGEKAIIMSGTIRKEVGKDAAAIRQALIEVWAERFPDAMDKASQTFTAKMAILRSNVFELQANIANKFLPILKNWVDGLSNAVNDSSEKMNSVFQIVIKGIMVIDLGIRTLSTSWKAFLMNISAIGKGVSWAMDALMGKIQDMVQGIQSALFDMAGKNAILDKFIRTPLKNINELSAGIASIRSKTSEWANYSEDRFEAYKEATVDGWKSMQGAYQSYQEALNAGAISPGGGLSGTGAMGASLLQDREAMFKKIADQNYRAYQARKKILDAEIKAIEEEFAQEEQIMEKRKALFERQAAIAEQFGEAIVSGVGKGSEGLKESLKNTLVLVLEYLKRQMIAAKVASLAKASITMNPAALLEIGALAAAFEVAKKGIQSFATGTSFARGGLSLVGERGPELVNIPRGSQVYNTYQTRQHLTAPTTINLTITGNADQGTVANLRDELKRFADTFNTSKRLGFIT